MAAPQFEFRHWPLLLVRLPPDLELAALRPFYADWENVCRTFGRHVVLFDFRSFDPAFAKREVRLTCQDEVAKRRELFEATILAEARVVPHPIMHAIFSAFDWMVGAPWPVRTMFGADEAVAWVYRQAEALSVELPDAPARVLATLGRELPPYANRTPHSDAS